MVAFHALERFTILKMRAILVSSPSISPSSLLLFCRFASHPICLVVPICQSIVPEIWIKAPVPNVHSRPAICHYRQDGHGPINDAYLIARANVPVFSMA